ncbi:MAG: lysophospholipid acyltransferase family protein [Thermomicrobiales bacterium]
MNDRSAVSLDSDLERRTLRGRLRRVVRRILYSVLWVAIGLRIHHLERVPRDGAVLAVSNHLHNADPILTSIAFPRPVHYMAKKEAFAIPVIRAVLRAAGAFPVDRGKADRTAIRAAESRLRQDIAVGLFPEGTRSVTRSLQAALGGAGLLALTSGAPVLPVVVTGTERLPLNGQKGKVQSSAPMPSPGHKGVRILFGEPFRVPREIDGRRVSSDEATEIIMIEIARLLPPDYRGVYAERLQHETETIRRAIPINAADV